MAGFGKRTLLENRMTVVFFVVFSLFFAILSYFMGSTDACRLEYILEAPPLPNYTPENCMPNSWPKKAKKSPLL